MTLADAINELPEPLRRYVIELETNHEYASILRDAVVARENALALAARVRELAAELAEARADLDRVDAALKPAERPSSRPPPR